jgi:hypothetical protein
LPTADDDDEWKENERSNEKLSKESKEKRSKESTTGVTK